MTTHNIDVYDHIDGYMCDSAPSLNRGDVVIIHYLESGDKETFNVVGSPDNAYNCRRMCDLWDHQRKQCKVGINIPIYAFRRGREVGIGTSRRSLCSKSAGPIVLKDVSNMLEEI